MCDLFDYKCRYERLKKAVKTVINVQAVNVAAILLLAFVVEVLFPDELRQLSEAYMLGYLTSTLVTLLTLYFSVRKRKE